MSSTLQTIAKDVKIQIKFNPASDKSLLIEQALKTADVQRDAGQASADFRFRAAVAAFGQLLRGGKYTGDFGYDDVARLARDARGQDGFGYRGEFLTLVNLAKSLGGGNKQAGH